MQLVIKCHSLNYGILYANMTLFVIQILLQFKMTISYCNIL